MDKLLQRRKIPSIILVSLAKRWPDILRIICNWKKQWEKKQWKIKPMGRTAMGLIWLTIWLVWLVWVWLGPFLVNEFHQLVHLVHKSTKKKTFLRKELTKKLMKTQWLQWEKTQSKEKKIDLKMTPQHH